MRGRGERGWRRVEFMLGMVDAGLGISVTAVLTVAILASNPSFQGMFLMLVALIAHVQIALFARRHSDHGRSVDWWGLVASVALQIVIALLGIVSYGVLYAPAILLSVALLIVAGIRRWTVADETSFL